MLSPVLDLDFYRRKYPDLQAMSDDQAVRHFTDFGTREGRDGSPMTRRPGFLDHISRENLASVLEIGPFFSPALKGDNIRYFDIFDAEELRARAQSLGADVGRVPEVIHYTGSLKSVSEKFSGVFSSHAIEHQPDLIEHLRSVGEILVEGGSYYLIVPDKRYNFDHFLPESTLGGVMQANAEQRRTHTIQSLVEHYTLKTHNDAWRHWHGDHGELVESETASRARSALAEFEAANGAYLDTHAWRFTPESFLAITTQLHELGLIDLVPERVFNTPFEDFEFCAVLTKQAT